MRKLGQRIPVESRYMLPKTSQDALECLSLSLSIRSMNENPRTDLLVSVASEPPIVRVQFDGADPPERFWGKWLWAQIVTVKQVADITQYIGWIMRLTEILPETRELYFSCVSDEVDLDQARKAIFLGYPHAERITLGVPYGKHALFRRFYLKH